MGFYAKDQPFDKNSRPFDNALPAYPSQQSQNGVPVNSSVITLSANTTVIDVTAFGGASGNSAIIGKWGTGSVTGTNFDWIVQSGQTRTFVVPQSFFGYARGYGSAVGANVDNGLYNAVAVKTATAVSASVFTAEY